MSSMTETITDPEAQRLADVAFIERVRRKATSPEGIKACDIALQALIALRAVTEPGRGRPWSCYTPDVTPAGSVTAPSVTAPSVTGPCPECARREASAARVAKHRRLKKAVAE
jgi:hypothetical protein